AQHQGMTACAVCPIRIGHDVDLGAQPLQDLLEPTALRLFDQCDAKRRQRYMRACSHELAVECVSVRIVFGPGLSVIRTQQGEGESFTHALAIQRHAIELSPVELNEAMGKRYGSRY